MRVGIKTDQKLSLVLGENIRCSSPLNFSAQQQRAYFDGFGITAAAAFSFMRLVEPWEYSNTALIDWPTAGVNSAVDSFPFRHHSVAHTAWSAAETGCRRLHGKHYRWNYLVHGRRRGSTVNGASFVKWIHLRRFPVRIAKSVALLLLQRKDAFRAGEHPISRGEPKINKPYDKTKLCKTLIMFRMSILMCRGHCGLMEDVSQRRECLTLVCVAVVSECIFFFLLNYLTITDLIKHWCMVSRSLHWF